MVLLPIDTTPIGCNTPKARTLSIISGDATALCSRAVEIVRGTTSRNTGAASRCGVGVVTVVVRQRESEPIPRLTCGATFATPMREWDLVELSAGHS